MFASTGLHNLLRFNSISSSFHLFHFSLFSSLSSLLSLLVQNSSNPLFRQQIGLPLLTVVGFHGSFSSAFHGRVTKLGYLRDLSPSTLQTRRFVSLLKLGYIDSIVSAFFFLNFMLVLRKINVMGVEFVQFELLMPHFGI